MKNQPITLKHPFQHDGNDIITATLKHRCKVIDRIKASSTSKGVFGDNEGDSVLISLCARLFKFNDSIMIPAEQLAEYLDYDDFLDLSIEMAGAESDDFLLPSQKQSSEQLMQS